MTREEKKLSLSHLILQFHSHLPIPLTKIPLSFTPFGLLRPLSPASLCACAITENPRRRVPLQCLDFSVSPGWSKGRLKKPRKTRWPKMIGEIRTGLPGKWGSEREPLRKKMSYISRITDSSPASSNSRRSAVTVKTLFGE